MKRLCFLISHKPDNRYIKRINILKGKYDLRVIFWNKNAYNVKPSIDGAIINEVQIPANQTNPLKRIPELIRFIRTSYNRLIECNPDAIYVGNLDMLYIAYKYKYNINVNVKIIYEIADLHRLIVDKQYGAKLALSKLLKCIEKKYCENIDLLVLTSMKFYDVYYKNFIDKSKVVFMPNMPEENTFKKYKKVYHKDFTVGFIGWIRYKKQLHMLIDAAKKAGVKVLFAGEDGEGDKFKRECEKYSHITYIGPFDYEKQICQMYQMVDCIYAVYDADMANVRVALPNKLYEAMMCEVPIIVAKNTYLSELVTEMGIGAMVDHKDNTELISELIKESTDKRYYNNYCKNCKINKQSVSLKVYNTFLLDSLEKIME